MALIENNLIKIVETLTSLGFTGGILSYTDEQGTTVNYDLSTLTLGLVESVTGNLVDNTDPDNPIVSATLSKTGTQLILSKGDGTQDIIELCPTTTSLTAQVYSGGAYNNALADVESTLTDVIELSDGTQVHDGKVIWTGHGLTIGDWYYLSCDTPGNYTNVFPDLGWAQQLFFVLDADTILIDIEEGYEVGPAINWLSEVNTTGGKNSLTKTSGSVSFNGQGVFGSIPPSTDGSYFFTLSALGSPGNPGFVGMSDTPLATTSFTDMTYSMFFNFSGDLFIYSNGSLLATFGGTYLLGDEYEMRRTGTTVEFYRNASLLYSFAITSTEELFFDTSLRSPGASLTNISLTI